MLPSSDSRHTLALLSCWLLLAVLLGGIWAAGPAYAVRGHEFGFVLGWGVSDGKPELEHCTEGCKSGTAGSGKGQLDVPVGVAVNEASGDFYVLDRANGRVERFGPQGEYLGEFDGSGVFEVEGKEETDTKPSTGKLVQPRGIAVDDACVQKKLSKAECVGKDPSAGDVYVADGFEHKVIDKFTATGQFVGQVPVPLAEGAASLLVAAIAVDGAGDLWVSDDQGLTHRGFDEFDNAPENNHLAFVSDENVRLDSGLAGLAVGREGDLFANTVFELPFTEVIQKFTSEGHLLGVSRREQTTGVGVEWPTGDVYADDVTSVSRLTPEAPATEVERFGVGHLIAGAGLAVNSVAVPGIPDREGPVIVADANAADVEVFVLEQPKPPTIEDVSIANVTSEGATLRGVVNPRGARSEYRFDYGACSSSTECGSSVYEAEVPPKDGFVGASLDFEGHAVSVQPEDLRPNTTYHFRIAARNELNAPGEFVNSGEVVFRTQPRVPVESLLDGRNWEVVSPAHKHGTLIRQILEEDVIQAAADGGTFTYETDTPTEDEPKGFSNFAQVIAHRTNSGWTSEDVGLSHGRATGQSIGEGQEFRFFSEDLSVGLVQPFGAFEPETSPTATEQTPYFRTDFIDKALETPCEAGCYQPLVSAGNVPESVRFGEEGSCPPRLICGPVVVGTSLNGRHVVLRSPSGLTETPEDHGGLYEWNDGQLALVSVLPEKAGGKPASVASGLTLGGGTITRGAVSADGSRVIWTGNAGKSLYLRDTVDRKTVEVNEGIAGTPVFETANADGSRVFFTSGGGNLYVYETDKGEATRITTPVTTGEESRVQGQIAGMSQDGSHLYFVADGRLDEEAKDGEGTCTGAGSNETQKCYLYLSHEFEGVWVAPRLVAVLSGADYPDFSSNLVTLPVRASPDGRWLVFMSQSPLTGYDNRDAASGARDEEVFMYDSSASRLICLSCNPSGARPTGVEYGQLKNGLVAGDNVWPDATWLAGNVPGWTPYKLGASFYQSRYVLDDGRVFFNSSDALVPGDVNGTEDVYEFEPVGAGSCEGASLTFVETSGGCVGLVSAGTSREESAFLDASVSGSDAFFLTASQLVRSDFDSALDVYDAHECAMGSPCLPESTAPQPACVTEASCKASPSLQPEVFGVSASALFSGIGNVAAVSEPASVSSVRIVRKRRLRVALGSCRRQHPDARKERTACERRARARFAVKSNDGKL